MSGDAAAHMAAAAQPPGAEPCPDRSRTVAGFLVEDEAEEDGGRLVRLSWRTPESEFDYRLGF